MKRKKKKSKFPLGALTLVDIFVTGIFVYKYYGMSIHPIWFTKLCSWMVLICVVLCITWFCNRGVYILLANMAEGYQDTEDRVNEILENRARKRRTRKS